MRLCLPPFFTSLGLLAAVLVGEPKARAYSFLQRHREAPPHPTVITTDYEGKTVAVVGAAGEFAEVLVDGRLIKLRGTPHYTPTRAAGYAPGFIRIESQSANSLTTYQGYSNGTGVTQPGEIISKRGDYEARLVSDTALEDCYIVVLFYHLDDHNDPVPGSALAAFRSLGALAAGRERPVKINSAYVGAPGQNYYFIPMFFTRGREIRSTQTPILDQFFRQMEMVAHMTLLADYCRKFPSANHAAVPYLRVPLTLPEGVAPASLPTDLKARFTITEFGEVDQVVFTPPLPEPVARWVTRELDGWLFAPRLHLGAPSTAVVNLPLSFQ
jgi:hypothetical protein